MWRLTLVALVFIATCYGIQYTTVTGTQRYNGTSQLYNGRIAEIAGLLPGKLIDESFGPVSTNIGKIVALKDVDGIGDFIDLIGLSDSTKFGAKLDASVQGILNFGISSSGTVDGNIAMSVNTQNQLQYPTPNTFAQGSTISLRTTNSFTGAEVRTVPENYALSIGGTILLKATASGEFCLFDCSTLNALNIDIGDSITVLEFNTNAGTITLYNPAPGQNDYTYSYPYDFGDDFCSNCQQNILIRNLLGIDGKLDAPVFGNTVNTFNAFNSDFTVNDNKVWIDMEFDLDVFVGGKYAVLITGVGVDLGDVGSFNIAPLDAPLAVKFTRSRQLRFTPSVDVTYRFSSPVSYVVKDPVTNAILGSGMGTSVTTGTGNAVDIAITSKDPISATYSYSASTGVSHRARDDCEKTVSLQFGVFELEFASIDVGCVCLCLGICLGDCEQCVTIPGFEFKPEPLYELGPETLSAGYSVFDRSWTTSLGSSAQGSFTIDPENPSIAGSISTIGGDTLGSGNRFVIFQLTAENTGDVPLFNVTVNANFTAATANFTSFRYSACSRTSVPASNAAGLLTPNGFILDDGRDTNPGPASNLTRWSLQLRIDYAPGAASGTFRLPISGRGVTSIGTVVTFTASATFFVGPKTVTGLSNFVLFSAGNLQFYPNPSTPLNTTQNSTIRGVIGAGDHFIINENWRGVIAGDLYNNRKLIAQPRSRAIVDYMFANSVEGQSNLVISSSIQLGASVPTITVPRITCPALVSPRQNLVINNRMMLTAGTSYGSILVASNGQLVLAASASPYRFESLEVKPGGIVNITTAGLPVNIHIYGPAFINGRFVISGGNNTTTSSVTVNSCNNDYIEFGTGSISQGTFYSSILKIRAGATVSGNFYASNNIEVYNPVTITAGDVFVVPATC